MIFPDVQIIIYRRKILRWINVSLNLTKHLIKYLRRRLKQRRTRPSSRFKYCITQSYTTNPSIKWHLSWSFNWAWYWVTPVLDNSVILVKLCNVIVQFKGVILIDFHNHICTGKSDQLCDILLMSSLQLWLQ